MGAEVGDEVMWNGYDEGIDGVAGAETSQTPGHGRGVFAVKQFNKGDPVEFMRNCMVCDVLDKSRQYTGEFFDADDYRKFLLALPQHLACEVTRWSYTSYAYGDYGENSGKPYIGLDLGIQSLINHSDEPNVGSRGVAVKDILPGDEFLLSYTRYEVNAWGAMGLGNWEGQMMGLRTHSAKPAFDDDANSIEDNLGKDWFANDLYKLHDCATILFGLGGECYEKHLRTGYRSPPPLIHFYF